MKYFFNSTDPFPDFNEFLKNVDDTINQLRKEMGLPPLSFLYFPTPAQAHKFFTELEKRGRPKIVSDLMPKEKITSERVSQDNVLDLTRFLDKNKKIDFEKLFKEGD